MRLRTALLLLPAVVGLAPRAGAEPPSRHEVASAVAPLLADPDRGVRFAAAEALGRMGPEAAPFASHVALLRHDRQWCVRAAAIRALGRLGSAGIAPLLAAFEERSVEERVMVVRALAWAGEEARPVLEGLREHPEPRVVAAVAEVLAAPAVVRPLPAPTAAPPPTTPASDVPALVEALADPWLDAQYAARDALLAAGEAAAVPLARAMGEGRYDVLWHAEDVLAALGPRGAAAADQLARLLAHRDENVREVAARLLGEVGPGAASAARALAQALADPRIAVRGKAMVALGRIGPAAWEAVEGALRSTDARVRAGAAFAAGWAHSLHPLVPHDPRLPMADPGPVEATGLVPDPEDTARAARLVAVDDLDDLAPERQRAVLRAGLRLRDVRAATLCASGLQFRDLDAWEAERAVELLLPVCFRGLDASEQPDCRSIFDYLGSEEVAATLSWFALSGAPRDHLDPVAGSCHRHVRPDLLPWLHAVERSPDGWMLAGASGDVWMPRAWSDRHRELSAAVWGGESTQAQRSPGLPPGLRTLLDAKEALPMGSWVRRWLLDARPGPADADRLLALLARAQQEEGWEETYDAQAILLSLGHLADEPTAHALREHAPTSVHARAALARRGDAGATEALAQGAREDSTALHLLLMVRPEVGAPALVDLWRHGPADGHAFAMGDLVELAHEGVRWSAATFAGLESALLDEPPETWRLAAVASTAPGLRTRAVAAALLERLEAEGPAALLRPEPLPGGGEDEAAEGEADDAEEESDAPDPEEDASEEAGDSWAGFQERAVDPFAFLHAAEPDRVRALLRRWVDEPEGPAREWALWSLLQLGDAAHGPTLLAWVRERVAQQDDWSGMFLEWLPRSPHPDVVAFLASEATESLRALAEARGIPPAAWVDPSESAFTRCRELLREDRPVEALLHALRTAQEPTESHPGLVRDPRVRAALEELRRSPGPHAVPWVEAQLALAGDEHARRAVWSAVRAGRHRWICYDERYAPMTLGYDPATYPFLLFDLETNCCRSGSFARLLEAWMGDEHLDYQPNGMDGTPARNARRWIELQGGRFVASPLSPTGADFVPAVR